MKKTIDPLPVYYMLHLTPKWGKLVQFIETSVWFELRFKRKNELVSSIIRKSASFKMKGCWKKDGASTVTARVVAEDVEDKMQIFFSANRSSF